MNFEVYPAIVGNSCEVVFCNEFVEDVVTFDVHIFKTVERSVEVEDFDAKAGKLGIFAQENAMKNKFDKFE